MKLNITEKMRNSKYAIRLSFNELFILKSALSYYDYDLEEKMKNIEISDEDSNKLEMITDLFESIRKELEKDFKDDVFMEQVFDDIHSLLFSRRGLLWLAKDPKDPSKSVWPSPKELRKGRNKHFEYYMNEHLDTTKFFTRVEKKLNKILKLKKNR